MTPPDWGVFPTTFPTESRAEQLWSPLAPDELRHLHGLLGDAPDDAALTVQMTAGLLRRMLAPHDRSEGERGAAIYDPTKGVTYRALVGRREGTAWLRRVEVIPDDRDPDPRVFRVPVQTIADAAARHLAAEDEAGEGVLVLTLPGDPTTEPGATPPPSPPSAEELRELVRHGGTRQTIADRYRRSVSRVDQWLRAARRERPDLNWPPVKHPGKPKNRPAGDADGHETD